MDRCAFQCITGLSPRYTANSKDCWVSVSVDVHKQCREAPRENDLGFSSAGWPCRAAFLFLVPAWRDLFNLPEIVKNPKESANLALALGVGSWHKVS